MTRDERATEAPRLAAVTASVLIVPFEPVHEAGFRTLVSETLREFGFEPDPELDPDLADPGGAYESLWVAVVDGEIVGSVALRELSPAERQLKRMYLRRISAAAGLADGCSRQHSSARVRTVSR
jgi:hypothetical protein